MAVENRSTPLKATSYTFLITAVVSTLLRCYVRGRIIRNFGVDDWCMLAALVTYIAYITCSSLGIHYGTGQHEWDLEEGDRKMARMYWLLCYIWYCTTMMASKISIGFFLLRITIRRIDIWAINFAMALTIVTGIIFFFVTLFQCIPVSYFWNQNQHGKCLDPQVLISLTYLYSACSVVCDFTFAILPLTLIWRLKMDRRSKIALAPIMVMACVASIAVVVRFAYVQDFNTSDFLYDTVGIAIWSTMEAGLAITAGSLATLRPLFRQINRHLHLPSRRTSASARPTHAKYNTKQPEAEVGDGRLEEGLGDSDEKKKEGNAAGLAGHEAIRQQNSAADNILRSDRVVQDDTLQLIERGEGTLDDKEKQIQSSAVK